MFQLSILDGNSDGGTDIWVYECYGGENQNWEWDIWEGCKML